MSSLATRLRERIQREGPISFRDWMQAALYDQREGYYCRPDRIRQGRAGDYRTAPETSSLFAVTFTNYFAKLFDDLGAPDPFTILEAGAGSGEFAFGVLTTLRSHHPKVFKATRYLIEEMGPASRIEERLSDFREKISFRSRSSESPVSLSLVRDTNQALPDGRADDTFTGIIFSNELIDAFPVHRVVMREDRIRELCVGAEAEKFLWTECDPGAELIAYLERTDLMLAEGQFAEINLAAEKFVSQAAAALTQGFLITVDYGAEQTELLSDPQRRSGTLRGFQRHQIVEDVLASPGEIDLTSTIDWTQMKTAGEQNQLRTVRHEPLHKFLLAEGLLDELERSAGTGTGAVAVQLRTGAREMIMPHGLAASFQVLVQQKVSAARP